MTKGHFHLFSPERTYLVAGQELTVSCKPGTSIRHLGLGLMKSYAVRFPRFVLLLLNFVFKKAISEWQLLQAYSSPSASALGSSSTVTGWRGSRSQEPPHSHRPTPSGEASPGRGGEAASRPEVCRVSSGGAQPSGRAGAAPRRDSPPLPARPDGGAGPPPSGGMRGGPGAHGQQRPLGRAGHGGAAA